MRPLHNVVINVCLAVIPAVLAFAISGGIRRDARRATLSHRALWGAAILVWLVFLPNTCYLLTEWRHYLSEVVHHASRYQQSGRDWPRFLDFLSLTAFYVMYSGSGLFLFCLAIWPLDQLTKLAWPARMGLFGLCALGVYLGLVLRFNSWQVATHPGWILDAAADALRNPHLALLIAAFAFALWALYGAFSLTMEGARLRLRSARGK